jgi:hypothetical protein
MLLVTAAVFFGTALPMRLYHVQSLNSVAQSRADALSRWLAADAGAALAASADPGPAVEAVAQEAGVVTAAVLSTEGRILAPGVRGSELVEDIPGIGAPGDVFRARSAFNGELLEVAQPVRVGDARAAIAWITFRPSAPPAAAGGVAVLGVGLMVALIAAFVAAGSIRRMTLAGLTALHDDVELAASGQLDEVSDPLGAKPVKDLAGAVNYLIARVRTGAERSGGEQQAPEVPVTDSRPPAPPRFTDRERKPAVVQPAGAAVPQLQAQIVTNDKFRVSDASAGCQSLLGVAPAELVGRHLIDAIPDAAIVDAVLKLLTEVTEGEAHATVTSPAKPFPLRVSVSRTGRDQPVIINLAAQGAPSNEA